MKKIEATYITLKEMAILSSNGYYVMGDDNLFFAKSRLTDGYYVHDYIRDVLGVDEIYVCETAKDIYECLDDCKVGFLKKLCDGLEWIYQDVEHPNRLYFVNVGRYIRTATVAAV